MEPDIVGIGRCSFCSTTGAAEVVASEVYKTGARFMIGIDCCRLLDSGIAIP